MTIATTQVRLSGDVLAGATFDAPYPSGHNASTTYLQNSHAFADQNGNVFRNAVVTNTGAGVRVRNSSGRTLPSGANIFVEIDVSPVFSLSKRKKIAVGILGQSNERGNVPVADQAAFPQAFQSFSNPSISAPIGPAMTRDGGQWFSFVDELYNWGYDAQIVNGGIGSLSFINHACGQVTFRNNSTVYRRLRLPQNDGDGGFAGQFTVQSGKLFRCTTGADWYAVSRGPIRPGGSPQNFIDYILQVGTQASAGADPATWAATGLGGTVTDGDVVWTNIDDTNSVGYSNGQVFSQAQVGLGWDPFGVVDRLHQHMQQIQDVDERWIILCNGQSDAQGSVPSQPTVQGWYTSALTNLTNFYLNRGYKVAIGLSNFNTTSQAYQWDTLSAARNAVLASFANNPNVRAGANMFAYFGLTPPLQPDQAHLTAAGAIEAGVVHANAFKAFLPMASAS